MNSNYSRTGDEIDITGVKLVEPIRWHWYALYWFELLTGTAYTGVIIAKLCGYIDWSWWWIAAPIWIPGGLAVALVVLLFGALLVVLLASGLLVAIRYLVLRVRRADSTPG